MTLIALLPCWQDLFLKMCWCVSENMNIRAAYLKAREFPCMIHKLWGKILKTEYKLLHINTNTAKMAHTCTHPIQAFVTVGEVYLRRLWWRWRRPSSSGWRPRSAACLPTVEQDPHRWACWLGEGRRQRKAEEEQGPSTLSTSECFSLLLVVLVFFGGEAGRQLLNTSKTLQLTTATYRKSWKVKQVFVPETIGWFPFISIANVTLAQPDSWHILLSLGGCGWLWWGASCDTHRRQHHYHHHCLLDPNHNRHPPTRLPAIQAIALHHLTLILILFVDSWYSYS